MLACCMICGSEEMRRSLFTLTRVIPHAQAENISKIEMSNVGLANCRKASPSCKSMNIFPCARMEEVAAAWEIITPLGRPVVPEVYIT